MACGSKLLQVQCVAKSDLCACDSACLSTLLTPTDQVQTWALQRDVTQACLLLQIAFKIYDQLQCSGLELTLHSYHTVLKGSRHLQAAGLQSLYAQMIADGNLVLKDKTFGYVFRAAATCGEGLPASWLIQVCRSFYR